MLFRCLRSGNTVDIEQIDDIDRMRTHEGYERVEVHASPFDVTTEMETKNEDAQITAAIEVQEAPQEDAPVLKKRGRPRKEEVTEI